MKCKEVQKLFHRFLDGELNPDKVVELQEHIFTCVTCKAAWQELHGLHSSLQAMPRLMAPKNFSSRVIAAFDAQEAATSQPAPRIGMSRLSPLMAGAAVIMLMIITVYSGDKSPTRSETFMIGEPERLNLPSQVQPNHPIASNAAIPVAATLDAYPEPTPDAAALTINDQRPVPLYQAYPRYRSYREAKEEQLRYAGEAETVGLRNKIPTR